MFVRVAHFEAAQLDEPKPQKPSRLNKTRDSIMLPRSKHSLICNDTEADFTTFTDNLTNVSSLSTWVHETKHQSEETFNIETNSNDATKLKMLNETEDITAGFSR